MEIKKKINQRNLKISRHFFSKPIPSKSSFEKDSIPFKRNTRVISHCVCMYWERILSRIRLKLSRCEFDLNQKMRTCVKFRENRLRWRRRITIFFIFFPSFFHYWEHLWWFCHTGWSLGQERFRIEILSFFISLPEN